MGNERERQQRIGRTQQEDADADDEPLSVKPVGDREVPFGVAAWRMATAGKISVPQRVENGTSPIVTCAAFLNSG